MKVRFEHSSSRAVIDGWTDMDQARVKADPSLFSVIHLQYEKLVCTLLSQNPPPDINKESLKNFRQRHEASMFVCRFPECPRRSIGFASIFARKDHEIVRHGRGILCDQSTCLRNKVGFRNTKLLRQHNQENHASGDLPYRFKRVCADREDSHVEVRKQVMKRHWQHLGQEEDQSRTPQTGLTQSNPDPVHEALQISAKQALDRVLQETLQGAIADALKHVPQDISPQQRDEMIRQVQHGFFAEVDYFQAQPEFSHDLPELSAENLQTIKRLAVYDGINFMNLQKDSAISALTSPLVFPPRSIAPTTSSPQVQLNAQDGNYTTNSFTAPAGDEQFHSFPSDSQSFKNSFHDAVWLPENLSMETGKFSLPSTRSEEVPFPIERFSSKMPRPQNVPWPENILGNETDKLLAPSTRSKEDPISRSHHTKSPFQPGSIYNTESPRDPPGILDESQEYINQPQTTLLSDRNVTRPHFEEYAANLGPQNSAHRAVANPWADSSASAVQELALGGADVQDWRDGGTGKVDLRPSQFPTSKQAIPWYKDMLAHSTYCV